MNNKIEIMVFIEDDCSACEKVLRIFNRLLRKDSSIELRIFNYNQDRSPFNKYKVSIVPAIFVNGRLKFYGEFNLLELRDILRSNQQKSL
jgi:predicted thioredoxin/glutaredoxin